MEQLHLQKFVSLVKERAAAFADSSSGGANGGVSSWIGNMARCALEAYHLGFGTEFFVTPNSSVLVEAYGDRKDAERYRSKAVFNHKFPHHGLTLEVASPGLFVDKHGIYWDVPLVVAADFASNSSGSGPSYHLCLQQNSGQPRKFSGDQSADIPPHILPGFCAKAAFSIKKNVDIWRRKGGKIKMVQPYDVFACDPHVSASWTIGSILSAFLGDNAASVAVKDESQPFQACCLHLPDRKASVLADTFASASCTIQYGNFQRLLLDLTRLHARMDFNSGSSILAGCASLAKDLYNSQKPDSNAMCALCPDVTLSIQQQVVGPVTFRAESKLSIDLRSERFSAHLEEPIFALEYAMKVLGSARATAWYSPKKQEAMVELRFFES